MTCQIISRTSVCLLLLALCACGGPRPSTVISATAPAPTSQSVVETRTYDISALLDDFSDTIPATGPNAGSSDRSIRLDEITKSLIDHVDPHSWQDNGGDIGQITLGSDKESLVVRQTPANQASVRTMLDKIGKAGKTPATHPD